MSATQCAGPDAPSILARRPPARRRVRRSSERRRKRRRSRADCGLGRGSAKHAKNATSASAPLFALQLSKALAGGEQSLLRALRACRAGAQRRRVSAFLLPSRTSLPLPEALPRSLRHASTLHATRFACGSASLPGSRGSRVVPGLELVLSNQPESNQIELAKSDQIKVKPEFHNEGPRKNNPRPRRLNSKRALPARHRIMSNYRQL